MPSVLDRLLVGPFWDLEFALAFALEPTLPLVAIGNKGDSLGASKLSTDDARWQHVFAGLAERARLIVLVPFASPGTLYEISRLASNGSFLRKTLWVMPPTYLGTRALLRALVGRSHRRRWRNTQKALAKDGIALPPYNRRGGLFLLGEDLNAWKQFPTDDFSEGRILPLAREMIAAVDSPSVDLYRQRIESLRTPPRVLRDHVLEWMFRRWMGRRLAGYSTAIFFSLLIALLVRTLLVQPFNIPSGSMKATLLVGDYLFVSKYSYGYSHYSFPLSPPLFSGRVWSSDPNRGDIVVFRLPREDSTDYIKRVIGLPGDHIQMKEGLLYINNTPVKRERLSDFVGEDPCGSGATAPVKRWKETLPNNVTYETLDCIDNNSLDDTPVYTVPPGRFFMMGDNRDNSTDSRVLSAVGYVPFENIVGRAQMIFFSIAEGEHAWMIWRWPTALRWNRLFKFVR
jgi:signal peptidase I